MIENITYLGGTYKGVVQEKINEEILSNFKAIICPEHKKSNLTILQWYDYAEMQVLKGNNQTQCPKCKIWLFPDEI